MESKALAQGEGPFGQVGGTRPGLGEVRFGAHIHLEARQARVKQFGDEILRVHARQERVELGNRLIDADAQRPAPSRRLTESRRAGQGEAAQGG